MTCQYCGREVEAGQQFCECGHPILNTAAAGSPSYAAVPMKRSSPSVPKFVWILLAVVLLGAGGYFFSHFMDSRNLVNEDTWHEVSGSGYTVTIPKALKKSDKTLQTSSGYKVIGFYTSTEAAFSVATTSSEGLSTDDLMLYFSNYSIDGQKLEPKKLKDDMIYFEYTRTQKDVIKKSDNLFIVDAMCVVDDKIYEAYAYCANEDKDKYRDSMIKWVESFEVK